MTDNLVNFRDFTDDRKPVTFKVQGRTISCVEAVPITTLQQMAIVGAAFDGDDVQGSLNNFFRLVMDEENFEIMHAGMMDKKNPITQLQATEIMSWLMKVYTKADLQSPSD